MATQYDRKTEDLRNVVMLEDVNLQIPDQAMARCSAPRPPVDARPVSEYRHQEHLDQCRQEPVPFANRRMGQRSL